MDSDEWITLIHISMRGGKPTEGDPQVVIVSWLAECKKVTTKTLPVLTLIHAFKLPNTLTDCISALEPSQHYWRWCCVSEVIRRPLPLASPCGCWQHTFRGGRLLSPLLSHIRLPVGERGDLTHCGTAATGASSSVSGRIIPSGLQVSSCVSQQRGALIRLFQGLKG